MKKKKIPVFHVDFNETIAPDLVLLSKNDQLLDLEGEEHFLCEGMLVIVRDDFDGGDCYLTAKGIVERNTEIGWSSHVKWCCRIDENGIIEKKFPT